MIFGFIIFAALIGIIEILDRRRINRQQDNIRRAHREFYDYVDAHYTGTEARVRKAIADDYIHGYLKHNRGWDYDAGMEEATTAKDRRTIAAGGMPDWIGSESVRVPRTGGDLVRACADSAGMTTDQWLDAVERFKRINNR